MAEPSATAGVAFAAGTITLTGSILGVHYDALLAGFFGGLVALSYLPAMPAARIAGTVAANSLLAGFFAPILAAAASGYFAWAAGMGDALRMAMAAGIGVTGQAIVPTAISAIQTWLLKKGGA